jgi:hypothetical protein
MEKIFQLLVTVGGENLILHLLRSLLKVGIMFPRSRQYRLYLYFLSDISGESAGQ